MLLEPVDEFKQRGQIGRGLQAAGHLAAEIDVDHPRGNGKPDFGTLQIQVFHAPAAELTHDREVMLTIKGMKNVQDRNFALVTGIITGRL